MTRINASTAIVAAALLSSSVEAKQRRPRQRRTRAPTRASRNHHHRSTAKQAAAKLSGHTSTVFVCGSSLHHAIQNANAQSQSDDGDGEEAPLLLLCPNGQDDQCPPHQHCYAGIPSSRSLHQRQLDQEKILIEELILMQERERQEGFHIDNDIDGVGINININDSQERFVCGTSWEDAVESVCSSSRSSTGIESSGGRRPIYCGSGTTATTTTVSSFCPSNMECYASVSCPLLSSRSSNKLKGSVLNKEMEKEEEVDWTMPMMQNLSSYQPFMLWESSASDADNEEGMLLMDDYTHSSAGLNTRLDEWFGSFLAETI